MNSQSADNAKSIVQDSVRIIRNTRILTVTQVILRLAGLLVTFLLARHLGVDRFGTLTFVLATVGLFNVFNDLGLSTLTVRDVGQRKSRLGFNLSYVGSLEILLSVCTSLLVIVVFSLSRYPAETKWIFVLAGVKLGFDGMSFYFRAVFRAFEKMIYDSLVTLSEAAFRVVGLIIAVLLSADLMPIGAIYMGASIFGFLVGLGILMAEFEWPRPKVSPRVWWDLLKRASPFMAYIAFNTVFNRADVTLVGLFMGTTATGLYGAAYRFYSMPLLPARAFRQSMFPRFSELAGSDEHERARNLLEISLRYLFALSLPLSLGVFLLADPIVKLIYGEEFAPAGLTLRILAIGIVPLFVRSVLGSISVAFNKEKGQTIIFAACVTLNILLNLWLIPLYSHVGAAIANTAFLIVYFVALLIYVHTFLRPIRFLRGLGKTLVAGLALAICLPLLRQVGPTGVVVPSLVGSLVYLVVLYVVGFFSEAEKTVMRMLIRSRTG